MALGDLGLSQGVGETHPVPRPFGGDASAKGKRWFLVLGRFLVLVFDCFSLGAIGLVFSSN